VTGAVGLGQDGQHHAVGVDQRDLQNVGQHLPPHRGLAGAVVAGDDDGQGLVCADLDLEDVLDGPA